MIIPSILLVISCHKYNYCCLWPYQSWHAVIQRKSVGSRRPVTPHSPLLPFSVTSPIRIAFSSSFHSENIKGLTQKMLKFRPPTHRRLSSHEITVHIGLTTHTWPYIRPLRSTTEYRSLIYRTLVPIYRPPFLSPLLHYQPYDVRLLFILFNCCFQLNT